MAGAFFLFGMALLARAPFPSADPPVHGMGRMGERQVSGVFLSDEGWYSRNARLHAIEGHWRTPEGLNPMAITPLFGVLQRLSFECLEVSLASARVVPILFGSASPVLLYLYLVPPLGVPFAIVGGLFLALDRTSAAYSRLALTETPYIALGLLSVLLLHLGRRAGRPRLVTTVSSLAALAAFAVKPSAASLALLVLLDAGMDALRGGWGEGGAGRGSSTPSRPELAAWWLLTLAGAGCLGLVAWLPYWGEDAMYLMGRMLQQRLQDGPSATWSHLAGFVEDGVLWRHWPFLTLCSLAVGIAWSGRALLRKKHRRGGAVVPARADWPEEVPFLLLWCILLAAGIATLSYQPLRYHLVMVPPMAGLAAAGLRRLWVRHRGRWRRTALVLVHVVGLAPSCISHGEWLLNLRYSLVEAARTAGVVARHDVARPLLCGRIADTLALENHLSTVNLPLGRPPEPIDGRLARRRPTHLILLRKEELPRLAARYPDSFGQVSPRAVIPILDNYYTCQPARLYAIPVPGGAVPPKAGP